MKLLLADENVLVPILVGLMKAYSCDSETMKHMLEIPSVFSHHHHGLLPRLMLMKQPIRSRAVILVVSI